MVCCTFLLPYAGIGIGFVAVLFGFVGFVRGKLPFTSNEELTGSSARIASGLAIILGFALIGFTVMMIRWFPEGLGH